MDSMAILLTVLLIVLSLRSSAKISHPLCPPQPSILTFNRIILKIN